MSLKQQHEFSIPEQTRRVARTAFPKGCACLRVADVLGCVYQDKQFAALFPRRGQPAEAPGRLALATVLQFMEGLPDRQAADAVRARIDWKYALGLELTDAGFNHTVLSEFRTRLVEGGLELLLLEALLDRAQALGLLKQRGQQRTDSTHVLAAVRSMNRLERVGETLRAVLNALAAAAPEWLRAVVEPDWFIRYGPRVENFSLPRPMRGVSSSPPSSDWTDASCCMPSVARTRVSGWQHSRRFRCWSGCGKSSSWMATMDSPVCARWTA